MALLLTAALLLIWGGVLYDLQQSRAAHLREAEVRTIIQSQVFAEYSRSTLKRINEFILNARTEWSGDWQAFSAHVKRAQENIDDIAFQVAIIDKDGLLAFSNLAKPSDRTDLSQREHFKVHLEAGNADRLFISRPLKGKVSGKWSIQMTRPILTRGHFNGVVVVSIGPDQFARFAEKLGVANAATMTIVRSSGEIMARYPIDTGGLGVVLKDRPFLGPAAVLGGNYRQQSSIDGKERIWGFHTLPEYGMTFVMGEAIDDILQPYRKHQSDVVLAAVIISLICTGLIWMLYRSLIDSLQVKQQLVEIFTLSPDGFVSFDAERRVSYVSHAFLSMTGLLEHDLTGLEEEAFVTRLNKLCLPNAQFPDLAQLAVTSPDNLVAGGNDGAAANPTQRHIIEIAGLRQRVLEVGLRRSQTQTLLQILYFRDITHEMEVDRLKSEFLTTAAHELRTPMSSVLGFAELLLSEEIDVDANARKEFVTTIYRNAELMAKIVNELLDLARIEARRGKDFTVESIDLGALVRQAVAGFAPPGGCQVPALSQPDTNISVRADRSKLTQAIGNVLSNAYKYSAPNSTVALEIVSRQASDQRGLMAGVRITDQGIGMTPEQLGRVCERFYRADASGKVPGTGLGMSIVKEIVELHGGLLEIASELGQGTKITLWLPASDD
jgi:signal transduction histidine kinase